MIVVLRNYEPLMDAYRYTAFGSLDSVDHRHTLFEPKEIDFEIVARLLWESRGKPSFDSSVHFIGPYQERKFFNESEWRLYEA